MKKLLTGVLKYHLIPILIATTLTWLCLYLFQKYKPFTSVIENHIVRGQQTMMKNNLSNCAGSEQAEIEFAGCLQNPNTITILGSSELGSMEYSPYYFLPDSLNMPAVAFGHAFQQHFSMFCELLAMKKHLKNAKICILISPSWFETEGTNIEAFLEFVRPNFLKNIVHNDAIDLKYKMEIGQFVSTHFREIEQPSEYLFYFKNLYENRNIPMLNDAMESSRHGIKNVQYAVTSAKFDKKKVHPIHWEKTARILQSKFLDTCKNNSIFVDGFYYSTYLNESGTYKKGKTDKIVKPSKNREYLDFLLLVEILKSNHCDATFIIQPLNPYHYNGLENYSEIISSVENVLKKNDFKYLNMFTTNKEIYEPGTLNDIMHLGNYGWLKVNRFLFENYK